MPAGHHIGDAALLSDTADLYLGDKSAVAIDEQFAVLQQTLVLADIEDDEIVFGIGNENLTLESWRQKHKFLRMNVNVQLVLELGYFLTQQFVFLLLTGRKILQSFVLLPHRGDLIRGVTALLKLGELILSRVAFLAGFGEILG